MKFREGQQVVIARNLGHKNRNRKDEYYYGGNLGTVPLHSKGKIDCIYDDQVYVRLENAGGWNVHPDEIELFVLDGVTEKMRNLERHPLFELASETPIYVVDNKVYASDSNKDKNSFVKSSLNLFFKKPTKVKEIASLDSLDELAFQRNQQKIDEIKEKYVSDIKEKYGFFDLKINKEARTTKFIFESVFPYLRGDKYDKKIFSLIGSELKKSKIKPIKSESDGISLEQTIEKEAEKIFEDVCLLIDNIQGRDTEKTKSLVSRVAGKDNFALINGNFYSLSPSKNRGDVNINGKRYSSVKLNSKNSEILEQDYNAELSKEIRTSVLREKFGKEEIIKTLKSQVEGVGTFCLSKYHEDDFGFLKINGGYYAYLEIPSFGIRYNRDYYLFRQSKIGIRVYDSDGNFDSYICRIFDSNSVNSICIGGAELPVNGKDKGEVIAKKLKQVKAMILAGNTEDWYRNNRMYYQSDYNSLKELNVPIFEGGRRWNLNKF